MLTFVEISGDGILLGSFMLTGGTLPQDFLIDVTNVDVVEIRATGLSIGYGGYVGIEATLKTAE